MENWLLKFRLTIQVKSVPNVATLIQIIAKLNLIFVVYSLPSKKMQIIMLQK